MSNTATLSASLTYTPPGGGANSASAALTVAPTYTVLSIATLDVPGLTAMTTDFAVPFGTIAQPKMVIIKNTNEQPMGVKLNGSAVLFWLENGGGEFILANPADAGGGYITSAAVTTTVAQSATAGNLQSWVFGDA